MPRSQLIFSCCLLADAARDLNHLKCLGTVKLCALILSETFALYKSFIYLLTYLNCQNLLQFARGLKHR